MNRSMVWACRASPTHHNRATPPKPPNPRNNTRNTHKPAYMRARARPISRARALPTNRHEGGSLT